MKNSARRNVNCIAHLADSQINERSEQGALALNGKSHSSLARVPSPFAIYRHDGLRFKAMEGYRRREGSCWIAQRRAPFKRIYPGTFAGVAHLEQMMMVRRTAKIEGQLSLLSIDVDELNRSWQDVPAVTKFFVPTLSHKYLSRPRLATLLTEGLQRKLTLVSAPAGFGKTTLASAWVRSLANGTLPARVAWITLDRSDNDLRRFWTVFLTALEQCAPGSVRQTLALLCTQPSLPLTSVLITLINQLAEIDTPQVVVLDDYQVINEPAIHEQLSFLLQHQPPSLHLLLLSRMNPPLALPRLRGRNEILELRAEHLHLTQEETSTFVRDVMGSKLPEEIAVRAEGWVTGLHLLDLCIQGQDTRIERAKEVRGSHRYILDYFVEEVLQQQPHVVQEFLLRTSILEQFCAPLCDAVMGKAGSQNILQELEDANVFIVALNGGRYRYHVLFAEALRARLERLQADEVEGLHVRASAWYAENGFWQAAIRHALLAHTWARAADLIEQVGCSISWQEGLRDMVRQWLDQIPEEYIHARPRLGQLMRRLMESGPALYPDATCTSPREHASSASDWRSPDPLSHRELEVLQMMAKGSSNRDIAERLFITVDTVKRHVSNILGKLQTSNRTQAVVQARMLGLLNDYAT